MENDLVSIIITTCNGDQRLVRAINSALRQSYNNIEIIVVDDNGIFSVNQKRTEKLISQFIESGQIKYIVHGENKNGAAARNTGVSNSSGKYIALLDDDDIYFPDRISKLIQLINSGNYAAAYSDVVFTYNGKPERIMEAERNGFTAEQLLLDSSLLGTGSNIFVRKNYYELINGFDESYTRYQDLEFMIRLLEKGKLIGCHEVLVMKDITDARFFPDFEDFLYIQDLFNKKNKKIIDHLDEEQLENYKLLKRKDLLLSAYLSQKQGIIKRAWQKLTEDCGEISFQEKMRILKKRVYMQYFRSSLIKKNIHSFRSCIFRNKHKNLAYRLSDLISQYTFSTDS